MASGPERDEAACIVAGARTPFVKAGGSFGRVHPRELGVAAAREALDRSGLPIERIDAVVFGNVTGAPDSPNLARVIAVGAGLPERVPACTVNRNCASGLEAILQAADLVASGRARAVLAGGVESMSSVPLLFPEDFKRILFAARRAKSWPARAAALSRLRPRHFKPVVALELGLTDPLCGLNMGETAEVLAAEFAVSRDEQDRLALESHLRAAAAAARLREEIAPFFVPEAGGRVLHEDVGPRPNQTLEALARLRPFFDRRRGTVTAGNSSPITDGAAAVVVASPGVLKEDGGAAAPLARVRSWANVGLSPRRMGLGPAFAVPEALRRAGVRLADVDLVEINEAFAAQVIACVRALASDRFAKEELGLAAAPGEMDPARTNVNGGAIALGHPVGASGARLVLTLAMEMRRRGAGLGLASLCVGGGQGSAVVLEAA